MFRKLLILIASYQKNGPRAAFLSLIRFTSCPFDKIDQLIDQKAQIVDLGCGEGVLTNYLSISSPRRKIVGIDLNSKKIKLARKARAGRTNIDFLVKDALSVDFSQFNVATLSDFLHHLSFAEQKNMLEKIARRARGGFVLVIKEVDKEGGWRTSLSAIYDRILYPNETSYFRGQKEWESLLVGLGFKVKISKEKLYFPGSTILFVCMKRS